jgi:hypothetical protein
MNDKTFELRIATSSDIENPKSNYISFSRNDRLKMYVYGIKANGEGPPVSGTNLNKIMMLVCEAMRISSIYISDSAGIQCHWNKDVELEHFSILRVLGRKPTFYESLKGHFWNVEKANEEKDLLQRLVTPKEKELLNLYFASLTNPSVKRGDCKALQEIIHRAYEALKASSGDIPELFRYVATPYIADRKKNTRKRFRRGRRFTRK